MRSWVLPPSRQPIMAQYVRVSDDYVFIQQKDMKLMKLSLNKLPDADSKYLETLRREDGSLPQGA